MRSTLKPLSPEEQEVARQNYWMIERFLSSKGLPFDEWYDVVVFRYLHTVQLWFRRPDLYKYNFSTIAWRNMSSAVCNERGKQSRRLKTISLDEYLPGSESMTWGDLVTEENLNFIPYEEVNR